MIHLIVGNTGAGKTTYSNELKKKTKGVIFSIDHWNNTLFFPDKRETDGVEWILERIERIESVIQDMILQLESSDTDTILDLGFAKFEHRQKFRDFALKNELDVLLHYLDVPSEVRLQRVLQRNDEQGNTYQFEVSRDDFNFMESWFEVPTAMELTQAVVVNS